ncbi:hypothetical protein L249_1534 [Ophiocordyceps polyrhachis-furcata BCC 54312]|uniref:Uncharacterized protein n=1 Tax=Ophiocordyceps polyrhachis-furcata BCC 54312 TaxID=1330021 RepID=A0A367L476_9HYPO|nr:hypothetical protein L249_1534 [Ophiocordyceps polyrhachis-furcata BCC 54312]
MRATLAILAALAGTAIATPVAEPTSFIKPQVLDKCPPHLSCMEFCQDKEFVSSDRKVDFGSCFVADDKVYCSQYNATNNEKMRSRHFDCTSENLVDAANNQASLGSSAHNVSDHGLSRPARSVENSVRDHATNERPPEDRERQKRAIEEIEARFKSSVDDHIKGLGAPCDKKTGMCDVRINASVLRDIMKNCDDKVGVFGYQKCFLDPKDMKKKKKKKNKKKKMMLEEKKKKKKMLEEKKEEEVPTEDGMSI